jgi:hypothetical protein
MIIVNIVLLPLPLQPVPIPVRSIMLLLVPSVIFEELYLLKGLHDHATKIPQVVVPNR